MDPVRGLIHLGLRTTEAALDRTLGVVRLVDTLLVASAVPPARGDAPERAWPDEEQADLDALSEALRARDDAPEEEVVSTTPPTRRTAPARPATKAPVRKSSRAARKAPAKKTPAKKAAAKTATKTATKKAATKKATKKATPKKVTSAKVTTAKATEPTPTPVVLPDA
ncbi:hypothetical protein N5P18_13910 [Janibacter terrae]|uniref:Uncharacterized protein n=1 Tax=Janibacter terrae TaxID=103817 RepID=A0ABZ2FET5_9MICO